MKKSQKSTSFKLRLQRTKAKLLSSYYGNITKDLEIICIAGDKAQLTAKILQQILLSADQRSSAFAPKSPFKASSLHKFFNQAWKAGSTHTIVVAPSESLKAQVFHGLNLRLAALVNSFDSSFDPDSEIISNFTELLNQNPKYLALNQSLVKVANSNPEDQIITFGESNLSDLKLESSKLYKKGSELRFEFNGERFTLSSFISEPNDFPAIAGATAIALKLGLTPEIITEGLAEYLPANL